MTNEPAVLSNFDPAAIGDELAALEAEAQSKLADAKGEFASHSEKIAAMRSTSQPEALDRSKSEIAQAPADRGSWGAPEDVTVGSIRVPTDRLPIDEDVVEGIVATIKAGNASALPPIHVWRKQTGNVPILVAGRNRLIQHFLRKPRRRILFKGRG